MFVLGDCHTGLALIINQPSVPSSQQVIPRSLQAYDFLGQKVCIQIYLSVTDIWTKKKVIIFSYVMSSFLSSVEIFFLAMYDPYNLHHTTVVSVSASSPHAHLSVAHMIRLLKIYLSFNYMLSRPTSSLWSCTYISGTYDPLLWWTLNKPLRIYILVTRIGDKSSCMMPHMHKLSSALVYVFKWFICVYL